MLVTVNLGFESSFTVCVLEFVFFSICTTLLFDSSGMAPKGVQYIFMIEGGKYELPIDEMTSEIVKIVAVRSNCVFVYLP